MVDAEDEAEIVGTLLPRKSTRPSQSSHTSSPSQHHSKPWPTPAGRDAEEDDVDPDEEQEEAVDNIVHSKGRRRFPHRDRDWRRDHTNGNTRRDARKGPKEPHRGELQPDMDNLVQGRSLSWLRSGPSELSLGRKGGEGVEAPPKVKSSLLFAQKSSLSALSSQARQILSNSAHSPKLRLNRFTENREREGNRIYITRPRPAREREKEHEREQWRERKEDKASRYPREVFPGVFLYQTGKTTKLVNLGPKGRPGGVVTGGRSLVSPYQLWPNPPAREGRSSPHNGSIGAQNGSTQRSASRAAGPKAPELSRSEGEPSQSTPAGPPSRIKSPPSLSHHPPVTLPRSNSTEIPLQDQVRVTSYLRTSEIIESQQQLDPEPNPAQLDQEVNRSNPDTDPEPEPEPELEEGELSDYSYEEVEARPGWAEDSINWQRTFSVNPMDFELLRSDWNDLRCNVSGNLQLAESEVVDVLAQYMEKLNERNGG